ALGPITIKGHKLFDATTKEEFFVKGVAYQPRGTAKFVDPLANEAGCRRDIPLMKELGINTLRVYQVDNKANHDTCMRLLADAGIYLLLDLPTPQFSIDRSNPTYDVTIMQHYRATADAFVGYDNMLGFIAGNEVTNDVKTTAASTFVKAALRDIKRHVRGKGPDGRSIPVGYASNDDPETRIELMRYFNCGDASERADFYGVNLYEWCGDRATFETSGYKDRRKEFSGYSVPIFLTEFGCNAVMPRSFGEVSAIFGSQMSDVLSGAIAYEFTNEENGYGLVSVSGNTVRRLPDYNNLKAAYRSANPQGVRAESMGEKRSASTCPAVANSWTASSRLPATPSAEACSCMVKTLSCVVDLNDHSLPKEEEDRMLGNALADVCGKVDCSDINVEARDAKYGKYSGCSLHDRVSWAYNAYYKK
ncbi:Glucanosyltransferase-domain-containing protein, partial [Thamnocephalis sphaerospora]